MLFAPLYAPFARTFAGSIGSRTMHLQYRSAAVLIDRVYWSDGPRLSCYVDDGTLHVRVGNRYVMLTWRERRAA